MTMLHSTQKHAKIWLLGFMLFAGLLLFSSRCSASNPPKTAYKSQNEQEEMIVEMISNILIKGINNAIRGALGGYIGGLLLATENRNHFSQKNAIIGFVGGFIWGAIEGFFSPVPERKRGKKAS